MALKLKPEMASLWHDLGVNYYYQASLMDKIMSKVLMSKSVGALQRAVTLDALDSSHWSALGVVAASKGELEIFLVQLRTFNIVSF